MNAKDLYQAVRDANGKPPAGYVDDVDTIHEFDEYTHERVKGNIEDILIHMGLNLEDPNLTDTPERVAKAFLQAWLVGYTQAPEDVMKTFPNDRKEHDMVVVKNIQFYSMCAHHLAPFFGKASIAYIPASTVAGLSKFARLVDVFARRLQLQEYITKQVADSLMQLLQPKGVMVVLHDVQHTCMTSRGVEKHSSDTTTSAVRGVFRIESSVRAEALSLMNLG